MNDSAIKVAIVTGGAAGIGRACVDHFLASGHNVLFTDISPEDGQAVTRADGSQSHHELPRRGTGYGYQIVEAMDCLRAGRTESDTMPLDETLSIMETMDEARSHFGLRYPADS